MATVNVSITLKSQAVPVYPPAASTIRYLLLQGQSIAGQADVSLPDTTASFPNVSDGEYTVKALRLTNVGTPIGDSATSQPFTVVNTTNIDVPDLVSVAL